MLSRIQGYEGKQVPEEVMKSVTDAVLELVRTLREVCDCDCDCDYYHYSILQRYSHALLFPSYIERYRLTSSLPTLFGEYLPCLPYEE